MWRSTVSFVNARVVTPHGVAPSLRFAGHVLSVGESPHRHDAVVDLNGAHVLPGLVNAHEHLELNHYGRLKFRERYGNASEWIDDMRPQLASSAAIRAAQAHRLAHRLFIGGLKNLLAGVTTIAHHNPLYREIGRFCAVRVVRDFGWAHSIGMSRQPVGARGEPGGEVAQRYRATPQHQPFILHLAEGVDDRARAELDVLDAAGALGSNTVIVHGVGLTPAQQQRVVAAGAGIVWCPSSNQFLFGETLNPNFMLSGGPGHPPARQRIALGSDSRVTGARDLLDEVRAARDAAHASPQDLLHLVTTGPAALLRLSGAGRIASGMGADFVILPAGAPNASSALVGASRRDVRLVVVAGRPLVGDADLHAVFRERRVPTRAIVVDEAPKIMDSSIARLLERSPIGEEGVDVEPALAARSYAFVTSR